MSKNSTRFIRLIAAGTMLLLLPIFNLYAQPEVCAIRSGGGGTACSGNSFGEVDYCQTMVFIVNYTIPSGYSAVDKFEWFVNNVSKKTTTTVTDNTFEWAVQDQNTTVHCNVTYRNSGGTLSSPAKSNDFLVWTKVLNLAVSGPISVTMGEQDPVNYSIINGSSCLGCYSPAPSTYSVTWTPISGWEESGSSNNGRNVTFTPHVNTGGTLTAIVSINGCPYQKSFTTSVSRPIPTAFFSSGNPETVCGSSANFSLNPVPGATSYTFTIANSTEATFTANGQQTITTTSNTVGISFSGTSSYVTLYGKANFGTVSTSDQVTWFQHGPPLGAWANIQPIGNSSECYETGQTYYFAIANPRSGVSYKWGLYPPTGPLVMDSWYTNHTQASFNFNQSGFYGVIAIPYNTCGDDTYYEYSAGVISWPYTCSGMRKMSDKDTAGRKAGVLPESIPVNRENKVFPNPAKNSVQVAWTKPVQRIRIYNAMGQLKKSISANGATNMIVSVTDLPAGVYFMVIEDGKDTGRKRIVIE